MAAKIIEAAPENVKAAATRSANKFAEACTLMSSWYGQVRGTRKAEDEDIKKLGNICFFKKIIYILA